VIIIKGFKYPINIIDNCLFKKEIKLITEIDEALGSISEQIEAIEGELNELNDQANLYINNVIKRKSPYNGFKHFIMFYDNNEIGILTSNYVDKHLNDCDIDEETSIKDISKYLPRAKEIYKITTKQYNRIFELIENVFLLIGLLEICNANFENGCEELSNCFQELAEKIKNTNIYSNTPDELFNEDEHDLVITKNEKNKWVIAYLKKEYKAKYTNYLKQQAKKS